MFFLKYVKLVRINIIYINKDNIAIYYKKKRLIKVFIKILKELKKAKEGQDSLIVLSNTFMFLFAKIGKKRRK